MNDQTWLARALQEIYGIVVIIVVVVVRGGGAMTNEKGEKVTGTDFKSIDFTGRSKFLKFDIAGSYAHIT